MKRWLIRFGLALAILLLVMTGLAWFLGATSTGLRWIVATVNALPLETVKLRVEDVRGTLVHGFSVGHVDVSANRARVVIDRAEGIADFWHLVGGSVSLDRLSVGRVRITIITRPPTADQPVKFLPGFLRLRVDELDARDIDIALPNGVHLAYSRVTAVANLSSRTIGASKVDARSDVLSGKGKLRLIAGEPLALSGDLDVVFTQPRQPDWRAHVNLKGDLDRLAFGADFTAPFHGTGRGEMTSLTKDWQLRGSVAILDFDVKAWKPDSTLGPAAAGLEIGGNHEGYFAHGKVTPRDLGTGTVAVRWRGHYLDRVMVFDELVFGPDGTKGEVRSTGTITLTGEQPRLDFQAKWNNLQWPVRGVATVVSERGHGTIAGEWPLEFRTDISVHVRDLPPAELTAAGEIASGHIGVTNAHGTWLDGTVSAKGDVRYGENSGWSVTADGAKLNPARWREAWPGQLDFSLAAHADGLQSTSVWQVDVGRLRGKLRGQALAASGSLRRVDRGFAFERVAVDLGSTHVRANGSVTDQLALQWTVSSPDIAKTLPGATGRIESTGSFTGTAQSFAAQGHVEASGLSYTGFSVKQLTGDVDVDLVQRGPARANIAATGLIWSGHELDRLALTLAGTTDSHDWTVIGQAEDTRMAIGGRGHYADFLWNASLDAWTLDAEGGPHLKLVAPASLTVGSERLALTNACLAESEETFCAEGHMTAQGAWGAKASATRLPLKLLGRSLPGRPEFDGSVAMTLDASQEPGAPWIGEVRAELSDADFQYHLLRGQREKLTLGEGHAEFTARPDRFTGLIRVRATQTTFLDANAMLTREAGRAFVDQSLSGAMHAEIHELGLIPMFVTEVDRVDGKLSTNFTLRGTPRTPDLDGVLKIDAQAIDLYQLNLQLRDTQLTAQLRGNTLELDATTHAGEGQATVKGHLAWTGGAPKGNVELRGSQLKLVNVPEVRIVASPEIAMHVDGRRIDINGKVTVPYARIAPTDLTGAVLPSSDEVIVGAPVVPPEKRFQVYSKLALTLGEDVQIETYGLAGKLSGTVTSTSSPDDPGTGVGELRVDSGKYTVLARRLDIERGRLIFNGGVLSNPGVDIRAVKRMANLVAGANVRGTLREPTLSFFSDPPVSQTQIISLLVAGGTLESLQSNETQQVGNARNQLLAQGGAILASELGAKLGLEGITVESNQRNEAALVLGKYLSPRLYVSYGVSLTEAINTLKLQYTLGDRWTIRTEAGEANSADIVYTIER